MEILMHLSSLDGVRTAAALGRACARAGVSWGCFFTNDGVRALSDADFVLALGAAARAVVCKHSWHLHMGDAPCVAELGSQTVNSALLGEARHVISL